MNKLMSTVCIQQGTGSREEESVPKKGGGLLGLLGIQQETVYNDE